MDDMFDDECPTNPLIVVQRQLDSAKSVVDEFLSAAYLLGYEGGEPHWTESILDEVYHIKEDDIMSILEENA
jgi:hypothetical protein